MNELEARVQKIVETELLYIRCFSQGEETEGYIRFTDEKLPDMYDHNFFYIKRYTDLQRIADLAAAEYRRVSDSGKGHVKILFEPDWEPDLDNPVFTPYKRETYLYMGIETSRGDLLSFREDAEVKALDPAQTEEEIFQLEWNFYKDHPDDFGMRRTKRKLEIYRDPEKPVELFLCYHDRRLIGDCEVLEYSTGLVKFEDFNILPDFQRKGFGTTVLRHLLTQSSKRGIPFAYVVADKEETAQDMYKKCRFSVLCEQTSLFFTLERS